MSKDDDAFALQVLRNWLDAENYVKTTAKADDSFNWYELHRSRDRRERVMIGATRGDLTIYWGVDGFHEPELPDIWLRALNGTPITMPRAFADQVRILLAHHQEFLKMTRARDVQKRLHEAGLHAEQVVLQPRPGTRPSRRGPDE